MEGEEFEGGIGKRLKKFTESGEVDYKTKSGTAWSHSYLNQKPWHPLSYPNQRRKWIAEQIHSNKQRRAEEVAREVFIFIFNIFFFFVFLYFIAKYFYYLSCIFSMAKSRNSFARLLSFLRKTRTRYLHIPLVSCKI